MEVYILDSLYRRTDVIDRFQSMIWTERYREIGDFELLVVSNSANRRRFATGTRLAITESVRVMTVETVENATDSEGRRMLKVKGRSLEAACEDRAALGVSAGVPLPEWVLTGTPEQIVRDMFQQICINGSVHPSDILPYVVDDQTLFPEDTIPESDFTITWYQSPSSLYAAMKEICDIYDLGFRLYRNGDTSQLFFNVYTGSDRTTQQTLRTPVIFSPELENVLNTTEFETIQNTKNVAYVMAMRTVKDAADNDVTVVYSRVVYPPDVDPSIEGFDRRAMYVSHTLDDTEVTEEDIAASLERKGQDELAKNRAFTAFDGEISQRTQYKYDVHYFLGDLVSMQNSDGNVNKMRVTEQIFVSDQEGDRAYPTLSFNLYISPGSWESWGFVAWEDVELTEYWDNQP